MVKIITRLLPVCILAFWTLVPVCGLSQVWDYTSMKEKVYIHTNHVYFKPGETVFFTCYLVDARTQRPSFLSSMVYVEIIAPGGNIIQKLSLPSKDGYAEGGWQFGDEAKGGMYKIRSYTHWMLNEAERSILTKEIFLQKLIAPRILMKLDFSTEGYGPGDEAAADFSMRNLTDQPIADYSGTYTVSIGGKQTVSAGFKTDQQGKAAIRFRLPADLAVNDALLNVSIQYKGYTESVSRSVPIVLNHIDLQFLPEGGSMVAGLPAIVAFKAVDEFGKGADVKGNIVDGDGLVITSFAGYHKGMGTCSFTPKRGVTYKAVITAPKGIHRTYALPAVRDKGIAMQVVGGTRHIAVRLLSTTPTQVTLSGYSRDSLYYTKQLVVDKEALVGIEEQLFPAGIARFTVSAKHIPLAERLFFVKPAAQLQIRLLPDKKRYLPREKVTLSVKTTDVQGQPIASQLSLSVVDDKLWTLANDKQHTILSWLLVGSELNGTIEEPSFYFDKKEPKAAHALDLVMLTHGYRYFDYISTVEQEQKVKYFIDQGQVISGVVLDTASRPLQTDVYLVSMSGPQQLTPFHTASDGRFSFSNLVPGARYTLLARPAKRSGIPVIRITQNDIGHSRYLASNTTLRRDDRLLLPAETTSEEEKVRVTQPVGAQLNESLLGNAVSHLDDVVVVGYGASALRMMTGAVSRIYSNDISGPLDRVLQGRVAGMAITPPLNQLDDGIVSIRGMRSLTGTQQPLVIVDGVPVTSFQFQSINPDDVNSVTVFRDAAAVGLFGARAANGVLVIDTRKQGRELISLNVASPYTFGMANVQLEHIARQPVRRFYVPYYSTTQRETRNDFRETIYWNGVVQTDRNGQASIAFYNSDASTTFRAMAEGIGYNGLAGRGDTTYVATEALVVDLKVPPCLTVGDRALLPLVIGNNGLQRLSATITVELPEGIVLQPYSNYIHIDRDSVRRLLVPVFAEKAVKGRIRVSVEASGTKQVLELPIESYAQGFPRSVVFSGTGSATHRFSIDAPVPGSLQTSLKIFRQLDEQLLNGIDRMLGEPYGCFEQTSSTLYPNIFILKYLKSRGRANAAIEQRAMKYIRSGYRKLLSFETGGGGFEWFGRAPGHLGLTAYGVLQFTDMKAFIEVDDKMLRRTREFLLRHRDSIGGFQHIKGAYGRFAYMQSAAADAYIVYALSKAGMGAEITQQYDTAVQKALRLKDGYLVTLMANAAVYQKKESDYQRLINLANKLYRDSGLNASTGMVGSYGESLRTEVLALYAMALMHDKLTDKEVLYKVFGGMLEKRVTGFYGSTQSIVLTLEAVTQYRDFIRDFTDDVVIDFSVNDNYTSVGSFSNFLLRTGDNVLTVRYDKDSSFVPYEFEAKYHTYWPPSSDRTVVTLTTQLGDTVARVGATVRMEVAVTNLQQNAQPMVVACIGIPAGLSSQPWQLKEMTEKHQVSYYEIFDNWLVFYWTNFKQAEIKKISLDLKAEIGGTYKAKASNVYLYYTPEEKHWNEGVGIRIDP